VRAQGFGRMGKGRELTTCTLVFASCHIGATRAPDYRLTRMRHTCYP
jgi:hypothetical protein